MQSNAASETGIGRSWHGYRDSTQAAQEEFDVKDATNPMYQMKQPHVMGWVPVVCGRVQHDVHDMMS